MYSCPGCGSQMLFDIPSQQLKCGRCDRMMSIAEADEKEARQAGSSFDVELLTCPTCGAGIHAINTAAASFCSYCGSSVMLEKQETEYTPPEKVIPFQITREECFEKYRNMLGSSFCADHRLKRNITADSFRGIYVPYHTYSASVKGTTTLQGKEEKGNATYVYKTQVKLNHKYEGILHDASREMPDNISEAISVSSEARDKVVPFSPAYLSGFYADTADTDPDLYESYAKSEAIRKSLEQTLPTLKGDSSSYSTSDLETALTSKAKAEYTGDTLAAVLYLLFDRFLTLRPEMVMVAAMILAVFAQLAVNGRRARIHDTEMAEAVVKGQTVNVQDRMNKMKRLQKRVNRQKNHGIFRYLGALAAGAATYFIMEFASSLNNVSIYHFGAVALTVLLGIIMFMGDDGGKLPLGSILTFCAMIGGCVLMIMDPFHSADAPVYIITVAIMAGVVLESLQLLRMYNKSCSNALPQFETHVGGEML